MSGTPPRDDPQGAAALHPCARCPRALGRSCCEVEEGEHLATLTRADVERVAEHTGLPAARFTEEEWLTPEEAHAYESHRPLYRGYFRRGPVRLTLRRVRRAASPAGTACVFHSPTGGCALPAGVRPTACLLYPFEPWPDGTFSLLVGRVGDMAQARAPGTVACLAVEEAEDEEGLMAAFGTSREALEALTARLRAEVHQHARGSGRT